MPANISAILKTALFTVVVPGTIAGYLPWSLRGSRVPVGGLEEIGAVVVIVIGAVIYLHTAFWGFAAIGGGTPAPIAPTRVLVVRGLHRYVRNPMYIGVALIVAGQAWLFHSLNIVVYLACILTAAHLFVLFYEEPTLKRQFGSAYDDYRARVPRWIPGTRL